MKTEKITAVSGQVQSYTPGITKTEKGIRLCTITSGDTCSLILYEAGKKRGKRIPFPPEGRMGDVWSMELIGEDISGYEYTLEVDGVEVPDPFGRTFTGRERWGDARNRKKPFRSRLEAGVYDWEGDRPLQTPLRDTVIYRMHPRGFTRHPSSKTSERGTFKAITEKIPYLKELGITAVELMPSYEFDEIMTQLKADGAKGLVEEPTGRLNYWGYGPGYYFAPKASYGSGGGKEADRELKDLVKELHRAGIELILELFFTGREPAAFVQEAVRFWVAEYHVDGIHLVGQTTGQMPGRLLAEDPVLSGTKLFVDRWEEAPAGKKRHLAEYGNGFLMDMRRALRGDEDMVKNMIFRISRNPAEYGVVNYMAHTNGYTMADMVTYEEKHNEANGEDNRDGYMHNCSWNCGVEGPDKNKKVLKLRRKQLRNAYLMLLLSQGTPMIQAGDEFGNTQEGNNNAYCQDNEISWLNWNQLKTNHDLYEFVKYLLAFRKAHPVFHKKAAAKNSDYLAFGTPDVSYHGVKAWYPEYESFRRQLGIMYNGAYEKKADGTPDDSFYVAYNMHWGSHVFGLPKIPKGMGWHVALNSDAEEVNGIYEAGSEPLVEDPMACAVPPHSIMVFVGKKLPQADEEEA